MWLNLRLLTGLIPSILVLAGLIYAQAVGASFPVPFLSLLATVIIAAAAGGRPGGLIAGLSGSLFIFYSHTVGFGPATLTGTVWNAILGSALFIGSGAWLGSLKDQRDATLEKLTLHEQTLQRRLNEQARKYRNAIAEIADQEARLTTAIRIAGLGHFAFNSRTGNCEICSNNHAGHFGLTPEEFADTTAGIDPELSFVHPEDQHIVLNAIRRIKFGETMNFEYRAVHRNGEIRHIHEIVEPTFDTDGNVDMENGTSMDITDLRRTEAILRESQKLEAVGRLTAGIAHDFNNLLAVVMGNLELLGEAKSEAETAECISAALGATRRGAALTHQLLSFGRKANLNPTSLHIPDTVDDLIELFRRTLSASIQISVEHTEHSDCVARVDQTLFESALLNLVVNSADAMPSGGILTISSGATDLTEDRIARSGLDLAPGSYVTVSIADTGCGMTNDVRKKAFDPFFTTKPVGTGSGMGLSMVIGFARQSGGDAQVESSPGAGTIVTLYFKRDRQSPRLDRTPALAGIRSPKAPRVLLVEDDDAVRRVSSAQLKSLGYDVLSAANGSDGLESLRDNADIEVLISDMVMPGPVQGCDLAKQALRQRPDLKVILMSGFCDFDHLEVPSVGDDVPVLAKPIMMAELDQVIRQSLSKTAGSRPQPV